MANTLPGTPYVESSDLVANYPAVSESLAERVDLVGILPFASSTARGTALPTPTDGQFSYLQDTNSTEFWNGAAWIPAGGKILQVVRATDSTSRSTNSTSYVDVTGVTVSITPTQTTSRILLLLMLGIANSPSGANGDIRGTLALTTSGNSILTSWIFGLITPDASSINIPATMTAWDVPNTTSTLTYKLRWLVFNSTSTLSARNDQGNSQFFAIEVAP